MPFFLFFFFFSSFSPEPPSPPSSLSVSKVESVSVRLTWSGGGRGGGNADDDKVGDDGTELDVELPVKNFVIEVAPVNGGSIDLRKKLKHPVPARSLNLGHTEPQLVLVGTVLGMGARPGLPWCRWPMIQI